MYNIADDFKKRSVKKSRKEFLILEKNLNVGVKSLIFIKSLQNLLSLGVIREKLMCMKEKYLERKIRFKSRCQTHISTCKMQKLNSLTLFCQLSDSESRVQIQEHISLDCHMAQVSFKINTCFDVQRKQHFTVSINYLQ